MRTTEDTSRFAGPGSSVPGEPAKPAADYDVMVDWGKRLAREAPFFRRVFEDAGVRRVVDVGAGSGKHDVMFAEWGLDVLGVDPDESMLAQARINAENAGFDIPFVLGGFGGLRELVEGEADAVLSLGNALPHLPDRQSVYDTVADMASVLRPGGIVVLHLLNHDRLVGGRVRTIPPVFRETSEGERVYLRVLHYADDAIWFDFITLEKPPTAPRPGDALGDDGAVVPPSAESAGDAPVLPGDIAPAVAEPAVLVPPAEETAADAPVLPGDVVQGGPWEVRSRRSRHQAIPISLLADALEKAGFIGIAFYGDHTGKPLDPEKDESVIVVARKA